MMRNDLSGPIGGVVGSVLFAGLSRHVSIALGVLSAGIEYSPMLALDTSEDCP